MSATLPLHRAVPPSADGHPRGTGLLGHGDDGRDAGLRVRRLPGVPRVDLLPRDEPPVTAADDGAAGPRPRAVPPGPVLVCSGLTARYRTRERPTIRDVDVVLERGGVMAVVGPSGSGKSTMCGAILGEIGDVTGSVVVDGVDLLRDRALAPRMVSFVPQRDALHDELTPRESLRLVARLRLGPAVDVAEQERRVDEVLDRLELSARADQRNGQLSGGQRKRVAVAMELLSDPRLLMLDEPTSGLDEGLDLVMMQLLRQVAADGRGVLVVTHSTANLLHADVVLALDVEGRLAYAGPPEGLLDALGVTTYSEAMAALRNGFRAPGPRTPPQGAVAPVRRRSRRTTALPAELGLVHATRVLLRREVTRLAANRLTLLRGTVLLPLLLCVLAAFAADRGLSGTAQDPNPMQGAALSVIVTCTTFFAMAMSFSTIVGDREVIEREHRWGVPPIAVVAAKALALVVPVVVQSVVAWSAYSVVRDGPETPQDVLPVWVAGTASLALLGLSSMALGLLVSASSRTLERAIILLMTCVAVLVVLTGLLIPLADPQGVGGHLLWTLAQLAPTRWGTAAISSYIAYVPVQAPGAPPVADPLWTADREHLFEAWASMVSVGLAYAVAAAGLLTRQLGRRR